MTPLEARLALEDIRRDLYMPKMMWGNQIGPQGDLYRAVDKLVVFLTEALS